MTTLETLAEYLASRSLENVPASSLHSAARCLLDALSCAAAGYQHPAVRQAGAWARRAFHGDEASVWFTAERLAGRGAAFVNACAASILDLDDGHRAASGHPGAAVVPAVLTMAQTYGASLETVLLALVCGYEAGLRAARAREPARLRSVATGRWSTLAVAAGVGKLLGLGPQVLAHALALAEAHAPNLMAADHAGFAGSDAKEGVPWSVLTGISSVEQAMQGLRGYLSALDNPEVYVPGAARAGLGEPCLIETTYFKPYACCRWIHGAIDAVIDMRGAGLRACDVRHIDVATFRRGAGLANEIRPVDLIGAQFSFPFCVAAALVAGSESLMPLDPALLRRGDVLALAERVGVREDDAMTVRFPAQVPCRIEVHTAGDVWRREVLVPLGDPLNPLDDEQLSIKAARLAALSGREEAMDRLVRLLLTGAISHCPGTWPELGPVLDFVGAAGQPHGLAYAPA